MYVCSACIFCLKESESWIDETLNRSHDTQRSSTRKKLGKFETWHLHRIRSTSKSQRLRQKSTLFHTLTRSHNRILIFFQIKNYEHHNVTNYEYNTSRSSPPSFHILSHLSPIISDRDLFRPSTKISLRVHIIYIFFIVFLSNKLQH